MHSCVFILEEIRKIYGEFCCQIPAVCWNQQDKDVGPLKRKVVILRLTAVVLVAPIRTVAEAVAAEASDDAVDPICAGEESRRAL